MTSITYDFPERDLLCTHMGKTLKKLRKNQNLKQSDLSELSQISRNTISLIECGKICPTFDIVYRLCIVLEISLSEYISYIETSLKRK